MRKEETISITFTTPAFLGGAHGSSESRVFPFKALYRFWWRVIWWSRQSDPSIDRMREEEGLLFGQIEPRALKSPVRFLMDDWSEGALSKWEPSQKPVPLEGSGRRVNPFLYLGYGALVNNGQTGAGIARPPAISPGTSLILTLQAPDRIMDRLHLEEVRLLWNMFGTIGMRSRNGWGSFQTMPDSFNQTRSLASDLLKRIGRPVDECLKQEWSHAIGVDARGLSLWASKEPARTWDEVTSNLAEIKMRFRTALPLGPLPIGQRHFLGYPVTGHEIREWKTYRLASQVFFKVLKDNEGYQAIAVHMPHGLPKALSRRLRGDPSGISIENQIDAWVKVHKALDESLNRL